MNCREFLIEFEERAGLTEAALLHLNDCRGCKKTNAEQTRVWQVIEHLETVDGPKDFDFRLKARIANAKPTDFQPRFLPALRYVLPLSLAVLVFAFVVFNSGYFVGYNSAPQVAEKNPPTIENLNPSSNSSVSAFNQSNTFESLPDENSIAEVSNPAKQPKNAKMVGADTRFVAVNASKD